MKKEPRFSVNPGWSILFKNLGISEVQAFRKAGLPEDLLTRKDAELTTEEYFRMWRGFETTINNPNFAIDIVKGLSLNVFDPPIFAACCSPNLKTALKRIKDFKPLIGAIDMCIDSDDRTLTVRLAFPHKKSPVPKSLATIELGFFVQISRLCTGENITPVKLSTPEDLRLSDSSAEFFGCPIEKGKEISITFSKKDCLTPFVTENSQMWTFFEEGLQKRLSELNPEDQMAKRVRAALLELLPSNQASVDAVAKKLFISRRTLQRRLKEEDTNFKDILSDVREGLALHYIKKSDLPYNQISFLLGYEDPNSFFRAFNSWTGKTPDTVRTQLI